jgi:hypothetical protein
VEIEILKQPVQFHLHGRSGVVPGHAYGQVGMTLMDEVWNIVKGSRIPTTGINHWVYLPDDRMFVGVELTPQAEAPSRLERLEFGLSRYLKHVHVGPYQELPAKWQMLKAALAARGEEIAAPSLEVYGHHCDDPDRLETTILISLHEKHP